MFLSGCDYLDVVPKNDIQTIETIFEKRENVDTWLKSCYVLLTQPVVSVVENPAFTGADEVVAGEFARQIILRQGLNWNGFLIGGGLQMSQEPYGNIWKKDGFYAGIRYCNIFFENIDKVYNMQESEKRLWTAELKALKAHFYFELMRRYGPITLVPENIPTSAGIAEMQSSRSPVDSCVKEIVNLLDEAIKDLPPMLQKPQNRWGYHSLESARALKAKVLLYAASPLFNGNPAYSNFLNKDGNPLISSVYDKEKWKKAAEAADSAIICALEGGRKLILGNTSKKTKLLNVMSDLEKSVLAQNFENDEAILMIRPQRTIPHFWYMWVLPYFQSNDVDYSSDWLGCIAPTMKMVEMYYTEHGLPIDADKEWNYSSRYQMGKETNPEYRDVVLLQSDVLNLHLRREPRFYAHIAADRCFWQRGKSISQNDTVKAYRGERFGSQLSMISNSVPQNLTGYWMKKGLYSDMSNVDYVKVSQREEAAIVIRLAELYLMSAEAWNEYLDIPNEKVYEPLNVVRQRAGILDVESAWINYSKNPEKIRMKEGMREIIHQEWNVEFAFEGQRF